MVISRSSADAEYHGVSNAVAKTCWVSNLLRELQYPPSIATIVYYNNIIYVYMTSNLVQHHRTKHIEINIHFVRNLAARGVVRIFDVPSSS